ncbi:25891_t:CDS:2, partial [Gigaspora rosea]
NSKQISEKTTRFIRNIQNTKQSAIWKSPTIETKENTNQQNVEGATIEMK